jgi:hypothetical protein
LQAYEREARRLYRGYWLVTNGLMMSARHARAWRTIIKTLEKHPAMFRAMMAGAMKIMMPAI